MFAICNLAIVPMRAEPSDRSEMVNQLLFGEVVKVIESRPKWLKIAIVSDEYQGWVDANQLVSISFEEAEILTNAPKVLNGDLIDYITSSSHLLLPIPLASELTFLNFPTINKETLVFEGNRVMDFSASGSNLLNTAFMYLNAPYLWGGKTPFGIDCSGFTQMVYKLNGITIARDASQQALLGEPLSFIEESQVGDLAFFDNEEGKIIHVGIIMKDNFIIHAHGKVRIDRLDHLGILNTETGRHTHRLRVIKKII